MLLLLLLRLLSLATAASQFLPAPVDARQVALDHVVRFPQLLDLLLQDRNLLVAAQRGV